MDRKLQDCTASAPRGPEDGRPPCPCESGPHSAALKTPKRPQEAAGSSSRAEIQRHELNRLLLTTAPKVGPQPGWPGPDPPLAKAVVFPGGLGEGQLRKHVGHVVAVER